MSEHSDSIKKEQPKASWLSRWTTLEDIERTLIDKPSSGFEAWVRTTAGVVVMLLTMQIITGLLLGFYYVPSTEAAHTTVAYIEKVVPAGRITSRRRSAKLAAASIRTIAMARGADLRASHAIAAARNGSRM